MLLALFMVAMVAVTPFTLEELVDTIYINITGFARTLHIIGDKAYENAIKSVMEKYESKLKKMEERGLQDTEKYQRIKKRFEDLKGLYEEETDEDLKIVSYSIDIEAGSASVTLQNIDDKPIDYVTGKISVTSPDGEEFKFESWIPIPLILKPGETKTYSISISGWEHGTYTIHAEVWRWNGDKIMETTITDEV